ncbi:hypothetical protein XU19_23770, partial [Vibrio parahaemolyticus]
TLGQVLLAAAVKQTNAPNIDRLLSDRDLASTDIDIGIAERSRDLLEREVVGVKLVQIDFDVVLLGRAAPRVHLNDSGNRQKAALYDPI